MSSDLNLAGRRVTLWGLGTHGGGLAAAEFLVAQGARLTVTDQASAQALAAPLAQLAKWPIERLALGGHDESLLAETDLIVVNPAVRRDDPLLCQAAKRGIGLTSEIELFLDRCQGTVLGVTGTNGKSSTCTMLELALRATGRRTWLGGNIGNSLLGELPAIGADDLVVLELSSFQIAWLNDDCRWPQAAVITNLSPNHLDWHGTMSDYVAAKRRLFEHLPEGGVAVFDDCRPEFATWRSTFKVNCCLPWTDDQIPALLVAGQAQRQNAALAAAMAEHLGAKRAAIAEAVANFTGLPHRVQTVADIAGRRFINDSKSTTPAATGAALDAMDRPTWLLLGGRNKGLDFGVLSESISRIARGVVAFGHAAAEIEQQLSAQISVPMVRTTTMREALDLCWRRSSPGDAILLSPACASFDQFADFVARGDTFVQLVKDYQANDQELS